MKEWFRFTKEEGTQLQANKNSKAANGKQQHENDNRYIDIEKACRPKGIQTQLKLSTWTRHHKR